MKIVTYNVNGLRPRIAQFGSLRNLLNSFEADIICFQETKFRRQEVTADLVMAEGYESFFSCTRTVEKGRTGYSGVATFCRINSAFSSTEVALPIMAEEGFTGLIGKAEPKNFEINYVKANLDEFTEDELRKVDSEGRCIITDHGHFVLFNIYGPRAESNDTERILFKQKFFKILQKRWESLMHQGRRIFVVGDLNIAPSAIDRCDAGPDFENNEFRRWFRCMLVEQGGRFFDAFRAKHPSRKEAFTCWPQNTGAEEFNYGTRIDHILFAGSCLHQIDGLEGHDFIACHVKDCDILTQYKRWKPGSAHRWNGGRNIKLEGSDHAPVYVSLVEIPDILPHNTPSLSARYIPMVHGLQQTIVSLLMKRKVPEQIKSSKVPFVASSSFSDENIKIDSVCKETEESFNCRGASITSEEHNEPMTQKEAKIKVRKHQCSQLSLKSFFQKCSSINNGSRDSCTQDSVGKSDESDRSSDKTAAVVDQSMCSKQFECTSNQNEAGINNNSAINEKSNAALLEWQRIQQLMQNSIPLCKGHQEPCVARVVKKQGPNFGRRFYVCARAEGPASNPKANCGYFKWAALKSRNR